MTAPERILTYIQKTYQPEAVVVYGSFADGSAGAGSDFDALVIAGSRACHDASEIDGVTLDVFVYPAATFCADYDPEDFVQIFDGKILLDRCGTAAQLQKRVLDYLAERPKKSDEELRQALDWCGKMLARTQRDDAEGAYRWHWLLIDSLEIYFDLHGLPYYGPKKARRTMEQTDPEAFSLYSKALNSMNRDALSAWIACLQPGI